MPNRNLYRTACALLLATLAGVAAAQPLRALILTSPGVYHNYEYQTRALAEAIASRVNVRFDVSLAEVERWKTTDFATGYDVLVYNICMADNRDAELIANLRRQSAQLDVPALVVHCAMHSFRETELWWPLFGLKTREHEAMRALPQEHAREHPVLAGIAQDWVVADDELYINLSFSATPLLTSMGEDGKAHVTAWLAMEGSAPVFGTTLGHSAETFEDPQFQRLLSNALLLVTGNLRDDGTAKPGLGPRAGVSAIGETSKPEGVNFLGAEGQDCVNRGFAMAIGPCYVGCVLHPFKWGAQARACKQTCIGKIPSADEMITRCMPPDRAR